MTSSASTTTIGEGERPLAQGTGEDVHQVMAHAILRCAMIEMQSQPTQTHARRNGSGPGMATIDRISVAAQRRRRARRVDRGAALTRPAARAADRARHCAGARRCSSRFDQLAAARRCSWCCCSSRSSSGRWACSGWSTCAIGSNFVMERKKQTREVAAGLPRLGIGTVDFVPFSRIKRIEVATDYESELNSGELQDIVHFEVVMVKDNDKRLTIGTVAAARPLADLGAERANRLAHVRRGDGRRRGGACRSFLTSIQWRSQRRADQRSHDAGGAPGGCRHRQERPEPCPSSTGPGTAPRRAHDRGRRREELTRRRLRTTSRAISSARATRCTS